ncbi:MAG: DUF2341 domain-containing protein [Flavobacteriales bacterium]|nr:DUF2341 domain-containing protein [Bacteroidota bacterium]MCB9241532.1 DUF2341 domain-containing protein [Flavobacteriales bacterium]
MNLKNTVRWIVGLSVFSLGIAATSAQPCYTNFRYRTPVVLTNSGAALSDIQVPVTINTSALVSAGKMTSIGKDMRFLNKKGNELKFWIEEGTMNTASTVIWVRADTLKGYSLDTIFMFYGNSSATPKSDASSTFYGFDDFNGTSLSSSWSTCGSGSVTVTGGKLHLSASSSTIELNRTSSVNRPIVVEMDVTSITGANAVLGSLGASGTGYVTGLTPGSFYLQSVSNTSCFTTSTIQSASSGSTNGRASLVWAAGVQKAGWDGSVLSGTSSTYSLPPAFTPMIGITGGSGTIQIEQFRIRGYAANMPSITLGTEVDMNFTITADYASPLCAGGILQLQVNTIAGASYAWTGPNSFTSNVQNPKITGVSTSDAGRYDVTVSISSGCASKSSSVNVNISPKAVGGTVSGTQTVCSGSNYGVLSLSGHTGNVARWDSSTNPSGPWYPISNTQLNQTYSNLTQTMFYRAIVTNGNCSLDSSSYVKITVTSPSDGGTLSGTSTVCSGSNLGTLTLSSYTGNVVRWEYSENGNLWYSMVNKTTSYQYTNLTKTMYYRAVVQNGNCNVDYSTTAIISVDLSSVGGSTAGSKTVCPDDNNGEITLTGKRGSVISWEYSSNGSSNWQTISVQSDTLSYANVGSNTYYRAIVKNGSCPSEASSISAITVFAKSSAGTLSGGTTVCEGSNSGTLSLSGALGTVLKWQYSTTGSWTDVASTATSYNWYNLDDSTTYRAVVANNGCKSDTSNTVTINVHKQTLGGYISGTDQVCVLGNTVSLSVAGTRGEIQDWETSSTGYAPWSSLYHVADTLSQSNLTKTNYFRVIVKNGVCPKATSATFEVKVDGQTVAGQAGPDVAVCEGTNFGVISLTGNTGDISGWQWSVNLNGSWTDVNNLTSKQEFQNLTADRYYRAVVQNGSCPTDTSSVAHVSVSKGSISGTLSGEAKHCSYTNGGTLRLTDFTGDIQYWESSVNNGDQWTKIPVNADTYTYSDLSKSTLYRVTIKSGACDAVTSNQVAVQIAQATDPGSLTTDETEVCQLSNFGNIVAQNVVGSIVSWQSKTPFGNWKDVANTSAQHTFYNLSEETSFRIIAKNEFCGADTSKPLVIQVTKPSSGGTISGKDRLCSASEDITITLQNQRGAIQRWEESVDGANWIEKTGTSSSLLLSKPTSSRQYRAVVKNGVCPSINSSTFLLTVDEPTVGGVVTGGKEVCSGNNAGVLQIKGAVGTVDHWESSENGIDWDTLLNTNRQMDYENVLTSTQYRAVVKNGVCASEASLEAALMVNPVPVVAISYDNLCDGDIIDFKQNASISAGYLTGYQWLFSDGFTSTQDQFSKSFQLPGKYEVSLKVISDKGCYSEYNEELVVGEKPSAYFTITGGLTSETACLNADLTLNNLTQHTDLAGLNMNWDLGNGATNQAFTPVIRYTEPGTYTITLTASSRTGCEDVYESSVTVFKANPTIAGNDVVVSKGIGYQLDARGSVSYQWSPAEFLNDATISNPVARISETTTFTVTGTDYYGCITSDEITLTVKDDYRVIPNNVITPDGNGDNDVWVIENLETYPQNKVQVFDRWGRLVFETEGYQNNWGATDEKGRLLMDGTYYYVLEFPEVKEVMKGAITVIKNR